MKKRLWILVIAILLIWKMGAVLRLPPSYDDILQTNWGIALPRMAQLTEVYAADTGASFHGDGLRCHVYSYEYEEHVRMMAAWYPTEPETIFYPTVGAAAEAWLEELRVPKEWRPDYEKCCSWYASRSDNSELVLFWDNGAKLLYVIESIL
ncbi:MAG: hypothetical protein IJA67_07700 [Oscillospiraceae bacterium]|nr:hypothetical protein [Oscillospiraceae bacterium]